MKTYLISASSKVDVSVFCFYGTPIIAYVLGSEVEPHAIDTFIEGSISIIPCSYNIVLRKAHSRTFNLIKKIEQIKSITYNTEIDDVLVSEQGQLFD